MQTHHTVFFRTAGEMDFLADESIDLVVTSPPYPMIAMWDEAFTLGNPEVATAIEAGDGSLAFECMHRQLDAVWSELYRVTKPGGFVCINVGDATRSIGGNFRLYSNHSRIISYCESLGFQSLPLILWRKQTNAPNKYMGSGMLPSGAYATLEHEYILVLRKGGKRTIAGSDATRRRRSAFFWEERNIWFSDLWDLKGVRQFLPPETGRSRSAAYPLELPHRLVNMYSMQEDVVLDPFAGTGTTTAAAILNGRNSIAVEVMESFAPVIRETITAAASVAVDLVEQRLAAHRTFVEEYQSSRSKSLGHTSIPYSFPVMTRQEVELQLPELVALEELGAQRFVARYTLR